MRETARGVLRVPSLRRNDENKGEKKGEKSGDPAAHPPPYEAGVLESGTNQEGTRPTSEAWTEQSGNTNTPIVDELERLTRDVRTRDQISVIIGPPVILLCDLIIPCIIYYVWLRFHPEEPHYEDKILGAAVACFGFGELYILIVRVWRLIKYHEQCAPLLSKHWWELDATSWVYTTALICGLIPFVVATEVGPESTKGVVPQLYLYAPGIYVAYLMLWCLATLVPIKTPMRVDSDPKGTPLRPLVYYAAEDFFAVDGWQGREFRVRFRARYDKSAMFRRMILELTIWWIVGGTIYIGCLSAIIWNVEFSVAFGLTLGLLFGWIILWAICTYIYVQLALEREKNWWNKERTKQASSAINF
ncbi:hypothetical protein GQ53DRAFT_732639 [Thozetella sp. PMI_491]|nr:hypothetical protein GQ53DRAFT_732639 [Thozetella sp. PMI_491]